MLMRRPGSVRDVRARRFRAGCGVIAFGVYVSSIVSGCATGVDTLEPEEPSAGDGSGATMSEGGKPVTAGSKATGGSSAGSSGGSKLMGAFGGTATSGGKGGVASTGGANTAGSGGKPSGGAAGSNSAGSGGGAGSGAGSGGGASGGSNSGAGTGGGGGTPLACLKTWKGDKCDTCSGQVQSDKAACSVILDCYYQNGCGPSMCGGNTDKCGANIIGKGTAGYPIAQDVYACLCK
jgi:hypothetical protein